MGEPPSLRSTKKKSQRAYTYQAKTVK
jgi:hypothetical protein